MSQELSVVVYKFNLQFLQDGLEIISVQYSVVGKLLSGFYGLDAGLVFGAVRAIVVASVAHRILHTAS